MGEDITEIVSNKMRLLFYIFILFPFLVKAQTFTLSDSTFKVGDKLITYKIIIDPSNGRFIIPECLSYLDTVALFLMKNKHLKIEVGQYCDPRGASADVKLRMSTTQAESILDYLVSKGVKEERIVAKGFGVGNPIISIEKIKKLKTNEEIEKAYQTNRRTELKILRTDYVE